MTMYVPKSFPRKLVDKDREVEVYGWEGRPLEELPGMAREAWAKQVENDPTLPPDPDFVIQHSKYSYDYGDMSIYAQWAEPEPDAAYEARYRRHLASKAAAEKRRVQKEAKERAQYEKLKEKFG